MDLTGKYEKSNLLGNGLGNGDVQVWRGREKARGTAVLLHTFTGSPRILRLAVEYLLARPASSPLIEIGEMADVTCLVTASELDMFDITAWLEDAVRAGRNAPPSPPSPMPQRVDTTGPVQALKPAPVQPSAQQPVQQPTHQPGEFTRAFQVPSVSVPPPRSQDPMATSGPTKPSGKPGEFTQLFQTPAQGRQTSQPVHRETTQTPDFAMPPARPETHSPAAPPAGEFTRLFRAQPMDSPKDFGSGGVPKQPLPPPSAPPKLNIASGPVPLPEAAAPPVPKGPGEYTRVMQAPSQQAPQASPAAQSPSPSLAQAVQLPAVSVTPPSIPSVPSLPSPPAMPTPQVPHVQASIPTPQIPTPQAPSMQVPAPSGQRPGISPVILLLGVLVLVALVLVLIFALRR